MNKIEELESEIKRTQSINNQGKINISTYNICIENTDELIKKNDEKIAEKQKELEVLKKQSKKRWRAEKGGKYFYVDSYGNVTIGIECKIVDNSYHYNSGNYYETQQQAERAKFETLFLQKLEDFARENNSDFISQYLAVNIERNNIIHCYVGNLDCIDKFINVKFDKETAQKALKLFKDELERYFLRED
jgi:hypothetical protein